MADEQLFCTFVVAGEHYAIPVQDVQEVINSHPLTNVPLAPEAVLGMMNIRGRIVSAIDMRKVLRLPTEGRPEEPANVVVIHGGEEVSLVVDDIGDILDLQATPLERAPGTLRALLRDFISGVFQLEGGLLLMLDIHKVLDDGLCTDGQGALTEPGGLTA